LCNVWSEVEWWLRLVKCLQSYRTKSLDSVGNSFGKVVFPGKSTLLKLLNVSWRNATRAAGTALWAEPLVVHFLTKQGTSSIST